jgi:hypothetical protein
VEASTPWSPLAWQRFGSTDPSDPSWVEFFSIRPRQPGTGQSGAGPPHSKELPLPLN